MWRTRFGAFSAAHFFAQSRRAAPLCDRGFARCAMRGAMGRAEHRRADPACAERAFFGVTTAPISGRKQAARRLRKLRVRPPFYRRKKSAHCVRVWREKRSATRAKNAFFISPYVRWRASTQKKVNESSRASCALTRFSCTLRD
jgi:hypothetical protein